MKVSLINEYKDKFLGWLEISPKIDNAFYYEVMDNWAQHWDIEALDFSAIYDKSLQSKTSARLWGGSINSPKSSMIELIYTDKEFIRSTFRDLFNENLDIGLRLDRFAYHADQVLSILKSKSNKIVGHGHQDHTVPCVYLALRYPDTYCLYDYPSFHKMMMRLESVNIPSQHEIDRYFKSCRGIYNLLQKDDKVNELMRKRIPHFKPSMMMMSLYMEFVATL